MLADINSDCSDSRCAVNGNFAECLHDARAFQSLKNMPVGSVLVKANPQQWTMITPKMVRFLLPLEEAIKI